MDFISFRRKEWSLGRSLAAAPPPRWWSVLQAHDKDMFKMATTRFHFAVRLFSYRSQMTSKFGKNKKVAHKPLGEWVTDVLTTF